MDLINRRAIWGFLQRLRNEEGTTLILSTHYLEEAAGCDQVAFMKNGRIIGQGTPGELVRGVCAYILEVDTEDPAQHAEKLISRLGQPLIEGNRLQFRVQDESFPIAEIQSELGSRVNAVHLRRPDLNDVYIWLNRSASEQG